MQLIQVMRLAYLIESNPEVVEVEGTSETSERSSDKEL